MNELRKRISNICTLKIACQTEHRISVLKESVIEQREL